MAESDDDDFAGLIDEAVAGHDQAGASEQTDLVQFDELDLPSSPELTCAGCKSTSKHNCAIEKLKGANGDSTKRGAWGKTSSRKLKCRRTHKKVRVIRKTGEWCRICYNIWRLRYRKRFKNKQDDFKADMANPKKALKKEFDCNRAEYVHLRAGGRSRVSSLKGKVVAHKHNSLKIIYPREVFYSLKKYKAKFGDPKKTKAKVVKLQLKNQKKVPGVIVREGEEGVFPIERSIHVDMTKEFVLDDGECVLDDQQLEEAMGIDDDEAAVCEMDKYWLSVDSSGAMSLEKTLARAAQEESDGEEGGAAGEDAVAVAGADSDSRDGKGDDEEKASESSSSSDDDESCSDSVDSKAAKSVAPRSIKTATTADKDKATRKGAASSAKSQASTVTGRQSATSSAQPQEQKRRRLSQKADGPHDSGEEVNEKEEQGTMLRDVEAESLQHTLQGVLTSFSKGAFATRKGRDKQALMREWKTSIATAETVWKRVAVSSDKVVRSQAAPLKALISQVSAVFNFNKCFSKFPNIALSEILAAEKELGSAGVELPAVHQAQVVSKSIDCAVSENNVKTMLLLLNMETPSPSSQEAKAWGLWRITDADSQKEMAAECMIKVFASHYLYRLPKETTIEKATKQAAEFLHKLQEAQLRLPESVKSDVEAAVTLSNFQSCSDRAKLDVAVQAATTAQNPKRWQNSVLSTFAISKVGRQLVKESSAAVLANATQQMASETLRRLSESIMDLGDGNDGEESDMVAQFPRFQDQVALFNSALEGMPTMMTDDDKDIIQKTVERAEYVFVSAFTAHCRALASKVEENGDDEVTE